VSTAVFYLREAILVASNEWLLKLYRNANAIYVASAGLMPLQSQIYAAENRDQTSGFYRKRNSVASKV
jgi:hypothetical protein